MPAEIEGRPKWRIALDGIDRVRAAGVRFGCVLGDAEYGKAAEFRQALSGRGLTWALGIPPNQKVFPPDVTLARPASRATGRPRKHPVPSAPSRGVAALFTAQPEGAFRTLSWRDGTKGPLRAAFCALRVRVADGPVAAGAQRLPGDEAWLVCEHRTTGERKYHPSNHPPGAALEALTAAIEARWACEQAHQQLKEELGLDHYEGRSWRGLHHHALLCQIALAFLQHLRLGGKKRQRSSHSRAAANTDTARGAAAYDRRSPRPPPTMSALRLPPAASPVALNVAEQC